MKGQIIKELKELGVKVHPETQKNLKHSRTHELIRLLTVTKETKQ